MRSRAIPVSACLVALVLGGAGTVGAQDAAAKGASLLAEARKAIGGEDRVAAIKRLEVKGVSRRSAGNTNIEGDLEIFVELPDKFRRNESISFGGGAGIDRVEVLNGADSWEETSGGGGRGGRFFGGDGGRGAGGGRGGADGAPAQLSPADLERLRQNQLQNRRADVGRLLLAILLTTDAPVTWIGTAQSPDGTADVLETAPGGTPVRLLLDSASHMPLMMTWQGGAPQRGGFGRRGGRGGNQGGRRGDGDAAGAQAGGRGGDAAGAASADAGAPQQADAGAQQPRRGGGPGGFQPATFEMHLSEYKAVNGVKLPHLITRGITGQTSEELEIKSYKVNPTFKANTFSK